MIEKEDFWNALSNDVREYLSMKYFSLTRCLLSEDQILHIAESELDFMCKGLQ